MNYASFTLGEILSQPETWAVTLDSYDPAPLRQAWTSWAPEHVVVTGCGSTYYLSMSAAWLLREVGHLHASAHPASELAFAPEPILLDPRRTVLVTISRSGSTSETLAGVDRFRQVGGAGVVTITCTPESVLAGMSDVVLAASAARERSIAQTRSFGSMFLLVEAIAASLSGYDHRRLAALPEACGKVIDDRRDAMADVGTRLDLDRFYFLGSGVEFGLASEAMLKLKEMSLTNSEAYHVLEFRHGPMSMVDRSTAVVGLVGPDRAWAERAVIDEMARLGGVTVDLEANVPMAGPSWARPILMLPPLQLLAYERAIAKGLDPDHPRYLTAVVELELSDPARPTRGGRV